jgi:transposase-like protein
MATKYQFKQKTEERRLRTFSDEFKRKKVREIEQKSTTIAEVSRQYEVREDSVSKWIKKYSSNYMKGVRVIVESESDTTKIALLEKKLAELERLVGQKQIRLEFYEKMIELAEEQYQVDIKKKFGEKPSTGSGTTEKI